MVHKHIVSYVANDKFLLIFIADCSNDYKCVHGMCQQCAGDEGKEEKY